MNVVEIQSINSFGASVPYLPLRTESMKFDDLENSTRFAQTILADGYPESATVKFNFSVQPLKSALVTTDVQGDC